MAQDMVIICAAFAAECGLHVLAFRAGV
jgi:hypothetical protein